jgi:hypothetical protein
MESQIAGGIPVLLKAKELAEMLGITVYCLNVWQRDGIGPDYIRLHGGGPRPGIRYPLDRVREWL